MVSHALGVLIALKEYFPFFQSSNLNLGFSFLGLRNNTKSISGDLSLVKYSLVFTLKGKQQFVIGRLVALSLVTSALIKVSGLNYTRKCYVRVNSVLDVEFSRKY